MEINECDINLNISPDVIIPSEWPKFFIKNFTPVEWEKKYPILDIGTGSGILAVYIGKIGYQYIHAIDITTKSVDLAKENLQINCPNLDFKVYQSNLFSNVPENFKFSLIVFNPPSFENPNNKIKITPLEYAFYNKKNIFDFTLEIIEVADKFLMPKGRLVFIVPSFHPVQLYLSKLDERFEETKIIKSQLVDVDLYFQNINNMGLQGDKILERVFNINKTGFQLKDKKPESFYIHLIEAKL